MTQSDISASKQELRNSYKDRYDFPKRSKILVVVAFGNNEDIAEIINGFSVLPANFLIVGKAPKNYRESKNVAFIPLLEEVDLLGIDATLCQSNELQLEKVMKNGAVAVVEEGNYLGSLLQEFHPGRAEGNSYLYEKDSSWSAYYALVRYLENHKFPYDNKNLVKNVLNMK